jgi:hypothetical protein
MASTSLRSQQKASLTEPGARTAISEEARLVNERFRARRETDAASVCVVLCECGRRDCSSGIELTVGEYHAICLHADHYIVVAGHESPSDGAWSKGGYLLVAFRDPREQSNSAGSPGSR